MYLTCYSNSLTEWETHRPGIMAPGKNQLKP